MWYSKVEKAQQQLSLYLLVKQVRIIIVVNNVPSAPGAKFNSIVSALNNLGSWKYFTFQVDVSTKGTTTPISRGNSRKIFGWVWQGYMLKPNKGLQR